MLLQFKILLIIKISYCNKLGKGLMSEEENSVEALIAKISSLEKDVATLTGENTVFDAVQSLSLISPPVNLEESRYLKIFN